MFKAMMVAQIIAWKSFIGVVQVSLQFVAQFVEMDIELVRNHVMIQTQTLKMVALIALLSLDGIAQAILQIVLLHVETE